MFFTDDYHIEPNSETKIYDVSPITGEIRRSSRKTRKKKSENPYTVMSYIGEIGFSIAFPIAGGALLGQAIDTKLGTYPKGTLSLILFGVIISFFSLYQTVKRILMRNS